MKKFASDYHFDAAICEMYPEIERRLMPLIKRKYNKYSTHAGIKKIGREDALQEARIALLTALSKFDYNRCQGKLERFAGVVLEKAYLCMAYEALAQSRTPYVSYTDEHGELVRVASASLTMDDLMGREPVADLFTAEDEDLASERERRLRIIRMRMMNALKGRDLDVFNCKTNPPPELLKTLQNNGAELDDHDLEITNLDIAEHLGISKNAVDWSISKIRHLFTDFAKDEDFIDLFGDAIEKGRPVIHTSEGKEHDTAFVRQIIAKRKLDPRPLADFNDRDDYCMKVGAFERMIERYPWGVVLVIKNGEDCRTLVIEGKVNFRSGEVFGDSGARERIPVQWYVTLAKAMQGANGV